VTKTEFEQRAAEMKARNLARPRFRNLPPPRSILDPLLATAAPFKIHIRDYLRDSDLNRLSPHMAAIKKLDTLETDRDGLLRLAQAGVQISVSPELLARRSEPAMRFWGQPWNVAGPSRNPMAVPSEFWWLVGHSNWLLPRRLNQRPA
jgi:hypothetical protein